MASLKRRFFLAFLFFFTFVCSNAIITIVRVIQLAKKAYIFDQREIENDS